MSNPSTDSSRDQALIAAALQQLGEVRALSAADLRLAALRNAAMARGSSAAIDVHSDPWLGSIEGYAVVRELRRGGQGVVYEAVQTATRRTVAIKVLYEGPVVGRHDRQRFEREVQILGQFRHPNIVTIHESGSVGGRFFYVMDYISGAPLDRYLEGLGDGSDSEATVVAADSAAPIARPTPLPERDVESRGRVAQRRSLRSVLELFATICDAVNEAHLRGVIHRDLKPSNILVDAGGEPHVLDFGLAKVLDGEGSSEAAQAMTLTGQFVGSLPWASPEQAAGEPLDLRTDVYSLGVILYQMLTGVFPYTVIGDVRTVIQNIRTAAPTPPSCHRRDINHEIETIVLKCLAKERERRYQSAGELARDVRHYLRGEPIEAKRDSFTYVLRKQLRRYRLPVALVLLFVALLVGGLASSLAFWRQAVRDRTAAQQAATRATLAQQEADRRREQAQSVAALLADMLNSANPEAANLRDYTVRQMLDEFSANLGERLGDQPEVEAQVRGTIGGTYRNLAAFDQAAPQLERALELTRALRGPAHPETADRMLELARLRELAGDIDDAVRLGRDALAILEQCGAEGDEGRFKALGNLGGLELDRGNRAAAEPLLLEAIELGRRLHGDDDWRVALARAQIGWLLHARDDETGAAAQLSAALETFRRLYPGRPHNSTAMALNDLGLVRIEQNELVEAEALLSEALAMYEQLLPPDHPRIAQALSNLAQVAASRGDRARAGELQTRVLEMRRRALPPGHPDLAEGLNNLAHNLQLQNRPAEALPLYDEAAQILLDKFGPQHPNRLLVLGNKADCYIRLSDYRAAAEALAEVVAGYRATLPPGHRRFVQSSWTRSIMLRAIGHWEEAAAILEELLAIRRNAPGDAAPTLDDLLTAQASVLLELGRAEPATALLAEWSTRHPDDRLTPAERPAILALRGSVALLEQRPQDAEALLREALELRRAADPRPPPWMIAQNEGPLADALAALGRRAEAEALAVQALEALEADPTAPPIRTAQARERLARLRDAE
jgi:serine/threonine protein kinase